jgi:hypothetical protein
MITRATDNIDQSIDGWYILGPKKATTNSGIDTILDHSLDFRMIIPATKEKVWKREKYGCSIQLIYYLQQ